MHWWAQQHKKAWTSTKDNSGGWSENPLQGKEKPFHNIQPSEERSPGGRHVNVKVYNQEKTSQKANTEGSPQGANKAKLNFAKKTSKKARPLLEKHSLDGWN